MSDYGNRVYEWYTIGSLREEVDLEKKEIKKETLQEKLQEGWREVV